MNRAAAKRVVALLVASELSAIIGLDGWAEQGLLDCYDDADRDRIRAACHELKTELYRRSGPADALAQSPT